MQQEITNETRVFIGAVQVSEDPIHLITIFKDCLYKVKVKGDKPGSVKRAF